MTTLGFGDIAANPGSSEGLVLLMAQVVLGYVLLGAIVTRLAVLFTTTAPARDHLSPKRPALKSEEAGADTVKQHVSPKSN